jgi:hypothetical protein
MPHHELARARPHALASGVVAWGYFDASIVAVARELGGRVRAMAFRLAT